MLPDMLSAVGHLLPIALAAALSTVPIMATILILLSPKRQQSAVPFLMGWVIGMAVVVLIGGFVAGLLPIGPRRTPQAAIGTAEIIIGSGVVVVAALAWRRARRRSTGESQRWMRAVSSFGPLAAFGSSFALNLRPKGLLLGAAAGLALASESLFVGDSVVVVLIYLAVATSTVVAPIIVTLAKPHQMEPRLAAARTWLDANSSMVTSVVMILVGVVIIGSGLSRL